MPKFIRDAGWLLLVASMFIAGLLAVIQPGHAGQYRMSNGAISSGAVLELGTEAGASSGPITSARPLPVACISGCAAAATQDINIAQILGAAPSLANPLFVSPATGASFAITGSISNTSFGATQATASSLNAQVVGPAASGAALSGNPVRIGLSDGTNAQNWLAAIALADGVNGNNTGAVAPWVWNGTTWDRMPGTTAGVTVRSPVAANFLVTATGPLTDTQLRASAVPISAASLPLPSGAASAANQTTWQSATGAAPPTNAAYLGANSSGATGGLLAGLRSCDSHAKYDASDNGSITLVTGVTSRKIYVCGFLLATGGSATNLKLREGSDANCATNAADITPAYQLAANDRIGALSSFWSGLVVSTNAYFVCVNASAGNAHQAEIWYTIQ